MLDVDDDNIWRINLFDILGVSEETPKDELRQVYKTLAKKYHPDRYTHASPEEQEEAKNRFSGISQAYEILSHDNKRHQYLETRRILADHIAAELSGQPISDQESSSAEEESGKAGTAKEESKEGPKKETKASPKQKKEEQQNYKRKEAEELYQEGQQYFRKNQLDKAISSFQQAIAIVSDNASYHANLGRAYLSKEWNSMAQVSFKKALTLNPNDPTAKKYYEPEKPKKKGFFSKLFGGK